MSFSSGRLRLRSFALEDGVDARGVGTVEDTAGRLAPEFRVAAEEYSLLKILKDEASDMAEEGCTACAETVNVRRHSEWKRSL